MKDLVILTPDARIRKIVFTLLTRRTESLGVRKLDFECLKPRGKDARVRKQAHEILREEKPDYRNALVIFDYHGCGAEMKNTAAEIEEWVRHNLILSGWHEDHIEAVVIDPELEVWIWGNSLHIAKSLGCRSMQEVRTRLLRKGVTFDDRGKPEDPKKALECILKETHVVHSSKLLGRIASRASLECTDRSFLKFRDFLRRQFPPAPIPLRKSQK